MVLVDVPTATIAEQRALERRLNDIYKSFIGILKTSDHPLVLLSRADHITFLHQALGPLARGYIGLDASHTWILFWALHSLALLDAPLPSKPTRKQMIDYLASCQHPDGGFSGGPYQIAHLATTYASVAALVTLGGSDALSLIHRDKILAFFLKMCLPLSKGGGMTVHEGGEVDIRGCYCALAACRMLNIDPKPIIKASSMVEFLKSCQGHEGGIGGEPGNEGHGGYAFCGLAAAVLGGIAEEAVDIESLLRWAVNRQGALEGGFMGRTNKLVDGCYSYWQGAIFPIVENVLSTGMAKTKKVGCVESISKLEAECDLDILEALKGIRPPNEAAELELHSLKQVIEDCVVRLETSTSSEYPTILEQLSDMKQSAFLVEEHIEQCENCMPAILSTLNENNVNLGLYNSMALQLWILLCCQAKAGLRDKPGKSADYYHTCYCLSGLSVSQHYSSGVILGGEANMLIKTDILCNVVEHRLNEADHYFLSAL